MVDFLSGLFFIDVVPYVVGTIILAVATLICFRLSRQRQSHGLFMIALGFLIKLIIDGSWNLFYWFALGGPFQALILFQRGQSADQISATITLTSWADEAITTIAHISMLAFIIYGAVEITRERADSRTLSSAPL